MIKKTIGFVAGKSGGHIIPALTLIKKIKNKDQRAQILFFSTDSILDKSLLEKNELIAQWYQLPLSKSPQHIITLPFFIYQFIKSFCISFCVLLKNRPEKLISMGGYVSLPVCLAAFFLRIPSEVYELNVVPGKAVNVLRFFAIKLFVCFEKTKNYFPESIKTSYPIRFELNNNKGQKKETAKKTIFIMGGSQGSQFINELVKKIIIDNKDLLQVIHQTGIRDVDMMKLFYQEQQIEAQVFTFAEDLADYYQQADVVITRAGAGSLFEIAFFKKKAIVIPLETASTCHQLDNAYAMAQEYPDLFMVLRQKDIIAYTASTLQTFLSSL